ncbi:hypothetical protein [Halococcus sp. IIIV-5B]|uniref:hypothetical protein n=1 Tax=Halococcus sp. IIIV-5B TaxID=2321230 RepID=UPI0011C3898A|nr:hypothetical protein [Halococcus sp. IIIV-5B]
MSPRSVHCSATVKTLSALVVISLVVSAGCSAGTLTEPSGQGGPVHLNVTNGANVTQIFEVSVVELPANTSFELPDGRIGRGEIGPGLSTSDPGIQGVYTKVKLPDSARLHGRYTLKPGETNASNISSPLEDFAVVVSVHRSDGIVSLVTATCGGDLTYVEVESRYSGSGSVYDCNEGVF